MVLLHFLGSYGVNVDAVVMVIVFCSNISSYLFVNSHIFKINDQFLTFLLLLCSLCALSALHYHISGIYTYLWRYIQHILTIQVNIYPRMLFVSIFGINIEYHFLLFVY
mgnify:FL=1